MSVTYIQDTCTFYMDGKNITYAFHVNEFDYPEHLYFGAKIPHDDLRHTYAPGAQSQLATIPGRDDLTMARTSYQQFMPELAFFGTSDYREPAVLVENPAGDRLSDLLYAGHEILPEKPPISGMPSLSGGETLVLHLRDRVSGFEADVYYTAFDDADVIARRVVYRNGGTEPAVLRRAYSFSLALPDGNYDALTLYGAWGRERSPERVKLHHGVFSVDSKRAASSATLNPFLAVMKPDAGEDFGAVWGCSLVYSSSFVLKAERNPDGTALVTGGVNDFDFSWTLGPGECFETPEIVLAYSRDGLGGMSRAFHDAFRAHLIAPKWAYSPRPLLINNWEGTYFDFDYDRLAAIADAAAGTGIDTFVLDDGWFGKRDDDHSGLGDWFVNETKLQGGLKRLIDHVHGKGMKFGLWFEPEMVNEDSDLFRAHPDWAVGVPGRKHSYSRHQLLLDLTRPEVRDYIADALNTMLRSYDIEYVKWDFNRNATEFYSVGRDPKRQAEFAHRYALGLYALCERIISANPDVFFEGCSSGGARFDPAMLHYFPQIWTSDDTDAEERTFIQYGTSLVYPLSAMSCHVSVCPNHQTGRMTPFDTRAAIAHLGATGYELDAAKFTEAEKEAVRKQTAQYRADQNLVLSGDLYRTENPFEGNFFAFTVVSKDKRRGKLTAYRRMGRTNNEIHRIYPKGLDRETRYRIPELGMTLSGAAFMEAGLVPKLPDGDFQAVVFHFEEA